MKYILILFLLISYTFSYNIDSLMSFRDTITIRLEPDTIYPVGDFKFTYRLREDTIYVISFIWSSDSCVIYRETSRESKTSFDKDGLRILVSGKKEFFLGARDFLGMEFKIKYDSIRSQHEIDFNDKRRFSFTINRLTYYFEDDKGNPTVIIKKRLYASGSGYVLSTSRSIVEKVDPDTISADTISDEDIARQDSIKADSIQAVLDSIKIVEDSIKAAEARIQKAIEDSIKAYEDSVAFDAELQRRYDSIWGKPDSTVSIILNRSVTIKHSETMLYDLLGRKY